MTPQDLIQKLKEKGIKFKIMPGWCSLIRSEYNRCPICELCYQLTNILYKERNWEMAAMSLNLQESRKIMLAADNMTTLREGEIYEIRQLMIKELC